MSDEAMSDEATAAEPPAETTTGIDISGPPQEMYKFLRDHMPVMTVDHELMQGTSVALHDDVMTVLQNPQIFSSDGAAEIGQIRPLIPLEIDPPGARQVSQAPRSAVRASQGGVARTVNESISYKPYRRGGR